MNPLKKQKQIQNKQSKQNNQSQRTSSMPVYPHISKYGILKDKLHFYKPNFPIMKSYQMLDQDLTSKEKASSTYWDNSVKEMSNHLWQPTKTALQDLDLTSSNSSLINTDPFCTSLKIHLGQKEMTQNEMKQESSKMTSWQSLQFLPPNIMDNENIKEETKKEKKKEKQKEDQHCEKEESESNEPNKKKKELYCRKFRFYPDKNQKHFLNRCFGTSRFMYNNANRKVFETLASRRSDKNKELEDRHHNKTYDISLQKPPLENGRRCAHQYKIKGIDVQCCDVCNENSHFCEKHKDSIQYKISYDIINFQRLRDIVLIPNKELLNKPEYEHLRWLTEIPNSIKQEPVKELCTAYKSNFALGRKTFKIQMRKKKSLQQQCSVDPRLFDPSSQHLLKSYVKSPLFFPPKERKKISKVKVGGAIRILKTKPDKFYLCIPIEKEVKENSPIYDKHAYKSVFLDPGERTFQTFYSPDGLCGKIGDEYGNRILPYLKKVDHLTSLMTKSKSRTRYHMKKRCALLRNKVKNLVNELHCKTCHFLCVHFESIFIPPFETQNMVKKDDGHMRCLRNETVRKMLTLSHYKFRMRLMEYGKKWNCRIYVVPEHYTSKTCGCCGKLHNNLGGNKVFNCDSCGNICDRDFHASRNICLKTLSLI